MLVHGAAAIPALLPARGLCLTVRARRRIRVAVRVETIAKTRRCRYASRLPAERRKPRAASPRQMIQSTNMLLVYRKFP
jgi:hypothetical protein